MLYLNQYYIKEKNRKKFEKVFSNDAMECLMRLRYENIDLEKVDLEKERKEFKCMVSKNTDIRKRFFTRII